MKKIISLVVFAVIYVQCFFASNFPYIESAENPTVSFIFSLLTIISFLCVTAVFSKSKGFLFTVSAFFIWILVSMICVVFCDSYALVWTIPLVAFTIPLEFTLSPLLELIEMSDVCKTCIFIVLPMILFYLTYFIWNKYIKQKPN